jgi:hypothetical protein
LNLEGGKMMDQDRYAAVWGSAIRSILIN